MTDKNEIVIFTNEDFGEIRTINRNGEPWFVGKDVAAVLGYADTNKAIAMHIDGEDKLNDKTSSSLGQRGGWLINESGLYSLIFSSKMPTAKKFKRWVTTEILPTIRKYGVYAVDALLDNPDFAIQAFTALKEEREKRKSLEAKTTAQAQLIEEMQPKATYYDIVLNCKELVTVNAIAKDYGKSAVWLNKWLHDHGIQYKQGKMWHLYQKYAGKGYTQSKTYAIPDDSGDSHAKPLTCWTQKGRLFLYELLKKNGILPLIEQNYDEA